MLAEPLDVAWIPVAAALVFFMQAGLTALESGLVRTKNSINVASKNFADFCIAAAILWIFRFALMFGGAADSSAPPSSSSAPTTRG